MTVDAVKNIEDLAQFVCDSPVSYLAARTVARRLQAAGFTELNETEPWQNEVAVGRHFVMRDGAIIAWAGGRQAQKASGYRVPSSRSTVRRPAARSSRSKKELSSAPP